jgi:SAM-dependent methyltransferase
MHQPAFAVLGLLAATVGLPYLLLSTTGPLLQAWYARTHSGGMPYRLYALSNLASLLGLLSYPVLIEPAWELRTQSLVWSAGYALFAVLCAAAAWFSLRGAPVAAESGAPASDVPASPAWNQRLLWIALAACPSVLLLAITRHLTQDVAPVPFLWVLPLCLYLLSFILCFDAPRYYYRPAFLVALPLALGGILLVLDDWLDILPEVVLLSLGLFVVCMVCHGEMVRRKPHPAHLTLFYLTLSIGGSLGGAFVGLLAPNIFRGFFELPIGLVFCATLFVIVIWTSSPKWLRAAAICAVCAYAFWLGKDAIYTVTGYRRVERNFYSQTRVEQWDEPRVGPMRSMLHGRIHHGSQALNPPWRDRATDYFCPGSGAARAFAPPVPDRPRKIGILGLGCGTLAVFGRAGDHLRIYEINEQVLQLARSEFTYLSDTPARVEAVLGDGRLTLEKEPDQGYDILVMDAFAGGSIPAHLLTLEATKSYLRHLRPDGILVYNITNSYIDLRPVMAEIAKRYGLRAILYEYRVPEDNLVCRRSDWVLMMRPETAAALPPHFAGGKPVEPRLGFRPWTDSYSNLFSILK